jgi:NAD(P)-dependent dehydrogenase (short-subunit alcohol dehydrogenase family)
MSAADPRARHAHQCNVGGRGLREVTPPEASRRRADRQHRLVLRQDGRVAQRRYCASKAAIGAITRCMAVEWAGDNMRVVDVAPGYIATDLNSEYREKDSVKAWIKRRIPVARPGAPEEVARLVGSLFRSDLGFLTGETIYIDGGQGMFH